MVKLRRIEYRADGSVYSTHDMETSGGSCIYDYFLETGASAIEFRAVGEDEGIIIRWERVDE